MYIYVYICIYICVCVYICRELFQLYRYIVNLFSVGAVRSLKLVANFLRILFLLLLPTKSPSPRS